MYNTVSIPLLHMTVKLKKKSFELVEYKNVKK